MAAPEIMLNIERTNSVNNSLIQHAIEADTLKAENTWKSMCLEMDKRAVQYFTQMLIIAGIMGFCIHKVGTDSSCVAQQSYTGLLTLLIGIVVPNPKLS